MIRLFPVFFTFAALLAAHGTELHLESLPNAVAAHFTYDEDAPARNAKVSVYSPADAANPYQTGQTDQRGFFAFVPDRAGVWRVVADDGEGHREEATVTVDEKGVVQMAADSHGHDHAAPGGALSLMTGLSIVFGITGLALWWTGRRSGPKA